MTIPFSTIRSPVLDLAVVLYSRLFHCRVRPAISFLHGQEATLVKSGPHTVPTHSSPPAATSRGEAELTPAH